MVGLESEAASTWVELDDAGVLAGLDISMCWTLGEGQIDVDYGPGAQAVCDRFVAALVERHGDAVFSLDGTTVDEIVARLLRDRRIAVADACTGGLLTARLSAAARLVPFGIRGDVSVDAAVAGAEGTRERHHADVGIALTAEPDPEVARWWRVRLVVATTGAEEHLALRLSDEAEPVGERIASEALHLLRRFLESRPTPIGAT
jgi:nicotinamide-nucleotide amidase